MFLSWVTAMRNAYFHVKPRLRPIRRLVTCRQRLCHLPRDPLSSRLTIIFTTTLPDRPPSRFESAITTKMWPRSRLSGPSQWKEWWIWWVVLVLRLFKALSQNLFCPGGDGLWSLGLYRGRSSSKVPIWSSQPFQRHCFDLIKGVNWANKY